MIGKYNVAEVSFNSSILVVFILYLQLESFYYLCYNNFIFFTKALKVSSTRKVNTHLSNYVYNTFYFIIFFFSAFFYKNNTFDNASLFIMSTIFMFFLNKVLNRISATNIFNTNALYLVLPTFLIFLFFIFYIKSLVVFFFFIELYSVLYYFCFLSSYNLTNQTLLKYKNGLLFLLWNNFLTSLFLVLGCFWTLNMAGTTNFYELSLVTTELYPIYCFLLGLFWKLGLPIFHFFKLEIYKYLLRENVFLFSILTTLLNVIILFITISQPIIFNTLHLHNWTLLVIGFSILLSIVNLNTTNILQFFAFSSVFTLTTVLSVFVI